MPNNYYTILQADLWVLVTVIQEEADFFIHHDSYDIHDVVERPFSRSIEEMGVDSAFLLYIPVCSPPQSKGWLKRNWMVG
jgi:hypothetical protein